MSSAAFVVELALKSVLLAAACILVVRSLLSRSSSEKALIITVGLASMLLLPLATGFMPPLVLAMPARFAFLSAMPDSPAGGMGLIEPLIRFLLAAYGIAAAALLCRTAFDIARLARLTRRSPPLDDPAWQRATATWRGRLGITRHVEIRVSKELRSPVSWGIFRPVILLDRTTAADSGAIETVIGHECAHIARLDWPAMVFSRLVTSLFWPNPLVWLLASIRTHLVELAADDLALRLGVPAPDYARALVRLARNSGRIPVLANAALLPECSLSRRVSAALDPVRRRASAGMQFTIVLAAAGLVATIPLAILKLGQPAQDKSILGAGRVDGRPPHPALTTFDPHAWDWAAELAQPPADFHNSVPEASGAGRADAMPDSS